MGLELPSPPETQAQQKQQNASPSATRPTQVYQLPSAALELASKLFDLAREGNTDMLAQYLQAGIPPNLTNHAGDTLLMLASYHGHTEAVSLLLSKGADPNVLNERGQSPLAGAVFKGYEEVARLLVGGGADVAAGSPDAKDSARMFRRESLFELLGVTEEDQSRPLPGLIVGPEGRPDATTDTLAASGSEDASASGGPVQTSS